MNLFVLFNVIVLIVFFFTIMGLVMVLLKDSPRARNYEPVAFGVPMACFLILVSAIIIISSRSRNTPVVVETISEPQIDTTILIHDNIADTSYTYIFHNIVVED